MTQEFAAYIAAENARIAAAETAARIAMPINPARLKLAGSLLYGRGYRALMARLINRSIPAIYGYEKGAVRPPAHTKEAVIVALKTRHAEIENLIKDLGGS